MSRGHCPVWLIHCQPSLCFINHRYRLVLYVFGYLNQTGILRQRRQHFNWLDEPDSCLAVLCKHGDTARQRHIQAHIGRQDSCGLHGIADFKNLAPFIKRDAFAAEGSSQIVNVQNSEPVALNRDVEVSGRLLK